MSLSAIIDILTHCFVKIFLGDPNPLSGLGHLTRHWTQSLWRFNKTANQGGCCKQFSCQKVDILHASYLDGGGGGQSAAILRRRRLPAQAAASPCSTKLPWSSTLSQVVRTPLSICHPPLSRHIFYFSPDSSPHNLSPRHRLRRLRCPPSLGMALHHCCSLLTSARSCCSQAGSRHRAGQSAAG